MWGFTVRGRWRPNINCNILTPLLWPSRCVFLVHLMLNRRTWGSLSWVLAFFTASYQHLLRTPTHQGLKPLRPGVAFPTTSLLQLAATPLAVRLNWQLAYRIQLSYIIVRRPLDLWNQMFNRHQAEITVMQFRGHYLPVHHLEWHFARVEGQNITPRESSVFRDSYACEYFMHFVYFTYSYILNMLHPAQRMWANECVILNKMIWVKYKYLRPFNSVPKFNYCYYMATLETPLLCAKKWLILNRIIIVW